MTAPTGPRYIANESQFVGRFFLDDCHIDYAVHGPYDDDTDRFKRAARLLVDQPTRLFVTVNELETPGPVAPDALAIPRADILRALRDALYAHAHESRCVDDVAVDGLVSMLDKMIAEPQRRIC